MTKIIDYLAEKTGGTCFKTYKYSFEGIDVPSIVYDDNQNIAMARQNIGETDRGLKKPKSLIEKVRQISKQKKPLFRYFLDGSRRTYKVNDIAYNERIYPIVAGQICVGCCERKAPSDFHSVLLYKKNVLVLPDCADKDGLEELFLNNLKTKINKIDVLKKRGIKLDKILSYEDKVLKDGEKYEHKGIAKIQDEMVEGEKDLVINLAEKNRLNYNNYLLKDGSLEYKNIKRYNNRELSRIKSNYRCVVGASKTFNPELCKDKDKKNIAKKIADLPLYHRTPAFRYKNDRAPDVEFSIWYLRVRELKRTIGPFDGVLKLEKILVSEDEQRNGLDSDEIDIISANLIVERNPTCYGHDSRWANHLYPIYLTEMFMKSNYIGEAVFLSIF